MLMTSVQKIMHDVNKNRDRDMKYVLALLAVLFSTEVFGKEDEVVFQKLLCEPDISAGFFYSKSKWSLSSFKGEKFILRRGERLKFMSDDQWNNYKYKYERSVLGDKRDFTDLCERNNVISLNDFVNNSDKDSIDSNGSYKGDEISCGDNFDKTIINIKYKKYVKTYLHGYIIPNKEKNNTPYMEYGKCVVLE